MNAIPNTMIKTGQLVVSLMLGAALMACQSVQDQTIPLSTEFAQNSSFYEVNKPSWRIKSSAYRQQFGPFTVTGADVSWKTSTKSNLWFYNSGLLDDQELADNWLKFMLSDILNRRGRAVDYYKVLQHQDFAFAVAHPNLPPVQAMCRLMALDETVEITRLNHSSTSQHEQRGRKHSYLGCLFAQGEESWQFVADSRKGESHYFQLTAADLKLDVRPVNDKLLLVNQQYMPMPEWIKQMAGVALYQQNRQISALSFDGNKPKIWLHSHLTPTEQAQLLALNYSLLMYDWLDEDWRSASFNL